MDLFTERLETLGRMSWVAEECALLEESLDAVLSVQSVGVFKPHKSGYDLVGQHFKCPKNEVLFVSSNGWDAAYAAHFGFHTVWVNRANEPMDRLPAKPHVTLSDLRALPELAAGL